MLKLNASYSKKVPVQGADYSSQSYHASVEVEIPDGLSEQQLNQRIHETFGLVRESVENELSGSAGQTGSGNGGFTRTGSGNGASGQPASQKQVNYLRDLATRQGLNANDLDARARNQFGCGLGDLTRQQASAMIDNLSGTTGSSRQRRAA